MGVECDYCELGEGVVRGVFLSRRRRQVLAMLADGFGVKVIADYLGVNESNVRTVIVWLREKYGVDKNSGLVRLYRAWEAEETAVAGVNQCLPMN